jgi:hypothetical protein
VLRDSFRKLFKATGVFKNVKVRSVRFVRGGEIKETNHCRCALPLSCRKLREDFGVPITDNERSAFSNQLSAIYMRPRIIQCRE